MKKNEMTKVEKINYIMGLDGVKDDEIAMGYLTNELSILLNRKNGESKADKERKAVNNKFSEAIMQVLTNSAEGLTTGDIAVKVGDGLTSQRVVAILSNLLNEDKVQRVTHKRRVYYILKERAEAWVEELTAK